MIPIKCGISGIIRSFVAPATFGKSSWSASEQALLGPAETKNYHAFTEFFSFSPDLPKVVGSCERLHDTP